MNIYVHRIIAIACLTIVTGSLFAGGSSEPEAMSAAGGESMMAAAIPAPPPDSSGGEYMKPSIEDLKMTLTPLQYQVTQQEGTEAPFQNEYWDNKEEGIYVDVVSGEALFSSLDKYKSGTGWPSFTRPLEPGNVMTLADTTMGMTRTEVRSYYGDSHLGHLFNDGPAPTGLRYCMNSASLSFIALSDLEEEGYGRYAVLFESGKE